MANNENLTPFNEMEPERQKEIAAMGGRAGKGVPTIKKTLQRMLAEMDKQGGGDGDFMNPIIKKLLQHAFSKGDLKAAREILDRLEGTPTQHVAQKSETTFVGWDLEIVPGREPEPDVATPTKEKDKGDGSPQEKLSGNDQNNG